MQKLLLGLVVTNRTLAHGCCHSFRGERWFPGSLLSNRVQLCGILLLWLKGLPILKGFQLHELPDACTWKMWSDETMGPFGAQSHSVVFQRVKGSQLYLSGTASQGKKPAPQSLPGVLAEPILSEDESLRDMWKNYWLTMSCEQETNIAGVYF